MTRALQLAKAARVKSHIALVLAFIAVGPSIFGNTRPDHPGWLSMGYLWGLISVLTLVDLGMARQTRLPRSRVIRQAALAAGCGLMAVREFSSIPAIDQIALVVAGVLLAIACVYMWREALEDD